MAKKDPKYHKNKELEKADLVSIITPCYNTEHFLSETIESIVAQTYTNWELCLINDCSTDKSKDVAKKWTTKDKRIKYYENRINSGAAHTRNHGIKQANGRFIAFVDSDDKWHPEKLEKQLHFMKSGNFPISFTAYKLIDEKGNSVNQNVRTIPLVDYKKYLKTTIIGMSTAIIDRTLVTQNLRFAENMRNREDTHFWLQLLKNGHTAHGLNENLAFYRVREGSLSSDKLDAAIKVWQLYFNIEKLGFLKSSYYFTHYALNAVKKRWFN